MRSGLTESRPPDRERVNQRFEEIAGKVTRAPIPENAVLPDWMLDGGMQHLEEFFSATAEVWDEKFGIPEEVGSFYEAVLGPIPETKEKLRVLDVGCGTGLALPYLFKRAPNAYVTGIDIARGMLERLQRKFSNHMDRISLIHGNCLDIDMGEEFFDYAISTLALHHLPPPNRKVVYTRILRALKPNGFLVEGDQSAHPGDRFEDDHVFHDYVSKLPDGDRSGWNYDVTLSLEEHTAVMREAGFLSTELIWEERRENGGGMVVLLARRGQGTGAGDRG